MAFLYILKGLKRYYIGSTTNLGRRLKQHQQGHTHTTKRIENFKLVFSQEFGTIEEARRVENKIKKWKRKDFIDKIIRDGYIK